MLQAFINNQLLALLAIILFGYSIGLIKVKGISFGNSACLFVAVAAGALGADIPPIITNLGIIFFVYSIGLQAGPTFFHLFNRRGVKYAVLAIFTALVSASIALTLAYIFGINTSVMAGMYSGALTSTPILASAIEALNHSLPNVAAVASLGYAMTYPLGLVSKVLFVQLIPRIFSKKIKAERKAELQEKDINAIKSRQYRLLNSNLAGKTLDELDLHKICQVNLTRFKRGEIINICAPDTKLEVGDIIIAVGTQAELDKFELLFGEEVTTEFKKDSRLLIQDIFISGSQIVGKSLETLNLPENYSISIGRLRRGDLEIIPTDDIVLEVGDVIRIVGSQEGIDRFAKIAGSEKKKLDETNILILALGMLLGALIGNIPFQLGSIQFKLGAAGGPLLVAVILSHFGKIGKWSIRLPNATKFFIRELGLVFFLIGIGVKTGREILTLINGQNILAMVAGGAIITIVTLLASLFFIHKILRVPLEASLGAICGSMTSTPALGVLIKSLDSETPTISYAAVYPVAVIVLTIMGQLIVWAGMSILP